MSTLVSEATATQCDMILAYLREHGSITQTEAAVEFGCWRLGARIWDLRHAGHKIKRDMVSKKNRYGKQISFARYTICEESGE